MAKVKHCYYCGRFVQKYLGKSFSGQHPPEDLQTKDHLVPKSKERGLHHNTVIACLDCNRSKGVLSVEEFRAVIAARKNKIWIAPVKIFYGEKFNPPEARTFQPLLPESDWKRQTVTMLAVLMVSVLLRTIRFVHLMNI